MLTFKTRFFLLSMLLIAYACHVPDIRVRKDMLHEPEEEYVMITTIVNFPMYVNHDQAAFIRWGRQRGVKTSILGPSDWDVFAQISVIEQVAATRPAGLLINGTDPSIASAIDKAVDMGIPTVVYDSDIPNSKRHCFLGTDWYELGRLQGEAMAEIIGGKGKVAYMGILGMTNMENGFRGMLDVFQDYPDIEIVGPYDDQSNIEVSAKLAADLLQAHPDMAGFCTFTPMSGSGVGMSLKEAGKAGSVKLTTVNYEPELLKLLDEGVAQLLVCQKRELFTWYGAQLLYDMNHQSIPLTDNDWPDGISSVPYDVNTGLFTITKENLEPFRDIMGEEATE